MASRHVFHAVLSAGAVAMLASVFIPGVPALADPRDISVGGVYICTITHDAAGYTSYARAVEVNRRISEVLSVPELRRGATVSVRRAGRAATITVGDILVFTVTPEDAQGTSVTPLELARQWAQKLAEGLGRALPDARFHTF